MTETVETTDAPKVLDWKGLIREVLAKRDNPVFAGQTSAFRTGISPASEIFAFGHTEKYLAYLKREKRPAARRAAAICAFSKGANQPKLNKDGKYPYRPIGHSLRDLKDKGGGGGNAITMQVNSLPLLDMESAAVVFGLLVKRCAAEKITVNYFDLARTLINWGNGISPESRETRSDVVAAFYQQTDKKTLPKENT